MEPMLPAVRAVLQTTPARWLSLTEAASEELLRMPPAPGEWSAVECLRHLRDAERDVFAIRLRAFLAGEDLAPYDPAVHGRPGAGETASELAQEFGRLREENLTTLAGLSEDDLTRTVNHGEYGPVLLGEQIHYWAAHDLMHTIQGERALMQPFIVRGGPWRGQAADHDAAASGG
jgi:hypothetical protein